MQWEWLEALRARGIAALLAHDPARAVESLSTVWEHTLREGVDDPGAFPVAPELVEALREIGESGERASRHHATARAGRAAGPSLGPRSPQRAARRSQQLASGYDEDARPRCSGRRPRSTERLGLRFDRARCLLALGRAQRRFKQWRGARETLEQAVAAFDELGADGWTERARSELERVGGRRRADGELTPSERRVVELAARGAVEQGDRGGAIRDREHGRSSSRARLREARRALPAAAGEATVGQPVDATPRAGVLSSRTCRADDWPVARSGSSRSAEFVGLERRASDHRTHHCLHPVLHRRCRSHRRASRLRDHPR